MQYHTSFPERYMGIVMFTCHSGYCLNIITLLSDTYAAKEM